MRDNSLFEQMKDLNKLFHIARKSRTETAKRAYEKEREELFEYLKQYKLWEEASDIKELFDWH